VIFTGFTRTFREVDRVHKGSDQISLTLKNEQHIWFYLDYSSGHIWTYAIDDAPQRVSQQIQFGKLSLTLLWSTRGSIVVKWIERRQRFNTTYFINEIIRELVKNLKATGRFQTRDGIDRIWTMPDLTFQNVKFNTLAGHIR
jgi:hypothetical protein